VGRFLLIGTVDDFEDGAARLAAWAHDAASLRVVHLQKGNRMVLNEQA
jgi:hypothetical protein